SHNCVDATCCEMAECGPGDRCDIFGEEGRCLPGLGEGSPCQKNTDCLLGLICIDNPDDGVAGLRCTFLRPTATPITPAPDTPTVGPTIIVSRDSGGCSIDQTGSAGGSWMLLGLPLMFWVRRAQR